MKLRILFFALIMISKNVLSNDNGSNQTRTNLNGNLITDQVLVQNLNMRQAHHAHRDPKASFKEKFSSAFVGGSWDALHNVPGIVAQLLVSAGAQLTVQGINYWINKPSAEDGKTIDQITQIAKTRNQIEVSNALEQSLDQLLKKNPDNERIQQALANVQREKGLLTESYAQQVNNYSLANIDQLKKFAHA